MPQSNLKGSEKSLDYQDLCSSRRAECWFVSRILKPYELNNTDSEKKHTNELTCQNDWSGEDE